MIELPSWYETPDGTATRAANSPHKEADENDSPSLFEARTRKRSCSDDVQHVHVGRHGFTDVDERRRAKQHTKRRSSRASPKGIIRIKHTYRSYNDNSQDYEDDRERVISFSLEPAIIAPSPPREKLQVMVQSDDGSVFALEIDEFTEYKVLVSSLRSNTSTMSTTAGSAATCETDNGPMERPQANPNAPDDDWVDSTETSVQGEEDLKDEVKVDEDGGGEAKVLVLLNRREEGYEKVRPYVRRLPAREQRSLYKKRPDLSPAYPNMFKKESVRESEPSAVTDTVDDVPDPMQMRSCSFLDLLI